MTTAFIKISDNSLHSNEAIMARVKEWNIGGVEAKGFVSACCKMQAHFRRESRKSSAHFFCLHAEACPERTYPYYINSKNEKVKFKPITNLTEIRLNLFKDTQNKPKGEYSSEIKRTKKNNEHIIPKAIFYLKNIVNTDINIALYFGDEKIPTSSIIDCSSISIQELIKTSRDSYLFAEVQNINYSEFNGVHYMHIYIHAMNGIVEILLSDKFINQNHIKSLNISSDSSSYVLFKMKEFSQKSNYDKGNFRVTTWNGKLYKIIGSTIYSNNLSTT